MVEAWHGSPHFSEGSARQHSAALEVEHEIGVPNRCKPVSDSYRRHLAFERAERICDRVFGLCIECAGGFIQHEQAWASVEPSRDTEALTLAAA